MPPLGTGWFLQITEVSRPGLGGKNADKESAAFIQFPRWLQLCFQALSQTWAEHADTFQEQQETCQLHKP